MGDQFIHWGLFKLLVLVGAQDIGTLETTGLYSDFESKTIATGVHEYEPQYPLWSDGSEKYRWIYLPPETQIDTSIPGKWVFPVGTKLWKEFQYDGRRIETRFLQKATNDSWIFQTFLWNEDETKTSLVPEQGIEAVYVTHDGLSVDIPSRWDCLDCHQNNRNPILGFEAIQLSAARKNPEEASLTLVDLAKKNLLSHPFSKQPEIPANSIIAREAMGYLHGNCGSCHNPMGGASHTNLYLKHQIPSGIYEREPAFVTAVNQLSNFPVPGFEWESYQLRGQVPEQSAILHRMNIRTPFKMPPIGSKRVDPMGVEKIRDWILELPPIPSPETRVD